MYKLNVGPHILCSKVEDATISQMLDMTGGVMPDVYHASPSCRQASQANSNKGETQGDIDSAVAIAMNIKSIKPKVFTLENVRGYRHFVSFKLIVKTLKLLGYKVQYRVVCAADYGVPQTRYRLMLVATRADMPSFDWPEPTHHDGPYQETQTLFGLEVVSPWVGWYEAIEDLIPTLEPDQFAQWQLDRLPEAIQTLLISSENAGQEWGKRYQTPNEPTFTITPGMSPRAFIVDCQNGGFNGDGTRGLTVRQASEPTYTLTGSMDRRPARALLINARSTSYEATCLEMPEPSHTVLATSIHGTVGTPKAWLEQGRVVRMSVKALARFQSVPDSYQFSGNNKLDCGIVGDGVPCKLAEAFGRQIVKLFE